jgi:hypothetical protein
VSRGSSRGGPRRPRFVALATLALLGVTAQAPHASADEPGSPRPRRPGAPAVAEDDTRWPATTGLVVAGVGAAVVAAVVLARRRRASPPDA